MEGEERSEWRYGVEAQRGRILETSLSERKMAHFADGALNGGMAFGNGITQGAVGVVTMPMDGSEDDDAPLWGLATGLGMGVAGFFTRTIAGTLDLAEGLTEGVRNTPDWLRHDLPHMMYQATS